MPTINEGRLQFDFTDDWSIIKVDDSKAYRDWMGKLDGTKAVDILGLLDNQTLYFIEVKDFREHRIENKPRLSSGDLVVEIAQKVRDTVTCIVTAYRRQSEQNVVWDSFFHTLENKDKPLKVVLWLEEDLPQTHREKVNASVRQNILKKKLKWLTTKVLVTNSGNFILPSLTVTQNQARV